MPRKKLEAPRDEVLTQKQLAARLDLDPRQIRNLVKRGMRTTYLGEAGEERGYAWPYCLHWYVDYKITAEKEKLAAPKRMEHAMIRELEAKAAKQELSLAQIRGDVLERDLVRRERQQAFEQIRNTNVTRASRWAPQLEGLVGAPLRTKLEDLAELEMDTLQRALLSIPTYREALKDAIDALDAETVNDDDNHGAAA